MCTYTYLRMCDLYMNIFLNFNLIRQGLQFKKKRGGGFRYEGGVRYTILGHVIRGGTKGLGGEEKRKKGTGKTYIDMKKVGHILLQILYQDNMG